MESKTRTYHERVAAVRRSVGWRGRAGPGRTARRRVDGLVRPETIRPSCSEIVSSLDILKLLRKLHEDWISAIFCCELHESLKVIADFYVNVGIKQRRACNICIHVHISVEIRSRELVTYKLRNQIEHFASSYIEQVEHIEHFVEIKSKETYRCRNQIKLIRSYQC